MRVLRKKYMKAPHLKAVEESFSKEDLNSISDSSGDVPHPTLKTFVSLETELPEALFSEMKEFLIANPNWCQYSLMSSALANFLFQNGCEDRAVRDRYLSDLFSRSE